MNTIEIRELTGADLDLVSGGSWRDNYKYCSIGTTAGGGAGLYPKNADCAVSLNNVIDAFLQGFEKGKGGSGQPA